MEYRDQDLLLIERPKPPLGWALGGLGIMANLWRRSPVARGRNLELSLLGQFHGRLAIFSPETLPAILAFDHAQVLAAYLKVPQDWLVKKVEMSC
jgi:hypothetical protein